MDCELLFTYHLYTSGSGVKKIVITKIVMSVHKCQDNAKMSKVMSQCPHCHLVAI